MSTKKNLKRQDSAELGKRKMTPEGERIRRLWEESGMTRQGFADFLNIPCNSLNAWIYGRRQPAPYVIEFIELKLEKLKNENSKIRKVRNYD